MDNFFINASIHAGVCTSQTTEPNKLALPNSFFTYHKSRRRPLTLVTQYARGIHDSPACNERRGRRTSVTREEYKRLVDYYRESYTTQAFSGESQEDDGSTNALSAPSLEKEVMIIDPADGPENGPLIPDADQWPAVLNMLRILNEGEVEQKQLFEAYSALPFPGVAYLEDKPRRQLLLRMSQVETKDQKSMMRYLSIIDDMKSANIKIQEAQWNSAIAFVGRCYVRVSAVQVEAALRMWKEMEEVAGVRSGHVTFSILFDVATKGGKYVLAEMVLKEMASRNLRLNRFAHTGLIYYYGLKKDGQGVRRAYRELVEAGHIVDSVVMDCVVASLLRAGELPAAEQVYERRKQFFAEKTNSKVPVMDWRKVRELGNVLDKAKLTWANDRDKLHQIQIEQYLGPDLRMYVSFIEYHVTVSGELRRVTNLLDEMQMFGIPMNGRIFQKVFKGFAYHGGVRYTSWTRTRLESTWTALKSVLDSGVNNVLIQKWMVIWIIKAYAKCSGRERTLELWAELRSRWKPDPDEMALVHYRLTDILNPAHGSFFSREERKLEVEGDDE